MPSENRQTANSWLRNYFFGKTTCFWRCHQKSPNYQFFTSRFKFGKTTCFWRCHRKIAKLPDFWLRNSILEKSHLLVQVSGKLYGIEFQGVCSSASHHAMIHPIDYPKYVYEWYPDTNEVHGLLSPSIPTTNYLTITNPLRSVSFQCLKIYSRSRRQLNRKNKPSFLKRKELKSPGGNHSNRYSCSPPLSF